MDLPEDEHVPKFQTFGSGQTLLDVVDFRSLLNTYSGPESAAVKGLGLNFVSRSNPAYEYELVLDPDEARRLVAEINRVLDEQAGQDAQGERN